MLGYTKKLAHFNEQHLYVKGLFVSSDLNSYYKFDIHKWDNPSH